MCGRMEALVVASRREYTTGNSRSNKVNITSVHKSKLYQKASPRNEVSVFPRAEAKTA